jgi:hypothetical protein
MPCHAPNWNDRIELVQAIPEDRTTATKNRYNAGITLLAEELQEGNAALSQIWQETCNLAFRNAQHGKFPKETIWTTIPGRR